MSTTLEVRWFETGACPPALRSWFDQLAPDQPSTWTDYYLPSADPGLNLKVRDDKIQIKRRLTAPKEHTFSSQATGHYEQWTKWSFDLDAKTPHRWVDDPTDLWTPLQKTRRQRAFDAENQTDLTTDLPTSPPAVVLIELTTLSTPEETAWTLCLEAEGPSDSLLGTLRAAGSHLLDADLPVSLSGDHSVGYARWLQERPSVQRGSSSSVQLPSEREPRE